MRYGRKRKMKREREKILLVGKSCQQDVAPNDIAVCIYIFTEQLDKDNHLDSEKETASYARYKYVPNSILE